MPLDRNRILTIGFSFQWRHSGFLDVPNLNEFDVVIWYPELTFGGELRSLTPSADNGFRSKLKKLLDWVALGHTLIIIMTPFRRFTYSNRGAHVELDLKKLAPFDGLSMEASNGQLVEFCGPEKLQPYLALSAQELQYSTVIKSADVVPLFKVSKGRFGSDQIVGGFKRFDNGFVIFVPPWRNPQPQVMDLYLSNLAALPDHLLQQNLDDLPPWSTKYQTDREKDAIHEIARLQEQISELSSQIGRQEGIVEADWHLKQLFAGSGEAFAATVAEVLSAMGLTVSEGPRGRADLIGYDGKRIFVFEAKGLEGTAREHNLRQTERWVSDIRSAITAPEDQKRTDKDLERYGQLLAELGVPANEEIECKGVMVIGTYRKMPINERKDIGFPDPVARPINRSHVCALSGLQLLGLYLDCRNGRKQGSEILAKIYATDGVFQEAADWRSFLAEVGCE
jgi:hypothetical protein